MPTQFTLEYALFVFISALGVLQFVFARNGLRGLLFVRRSLTASAALGALIVVTAFVWFFTSAPRNVPDTTLGLDGNAQARWFAIGSAAAVAVTFLVSSAINSRWGATPREGASGIDALDQTTFLKAASRRMTSFWMGFRRWTLR
jgi:hypothetical protein